jgi:hypothetical protein
LFYTPLASTSVYMQLVVINHLLFWGSSHWFIS